MYIIWMFNLIYWHFHYILLLIKVILESNINIRRTMYVVHLQVPDACVFRTIYIYIYI